MASESIWSLASQSLRLSTAADIEPHLELLKSSDKVTTIILTGNTIGVPASQSLAALLPKQKSLHTIKLNDIYTSRLLDEIPPSLDVLLTALLQCPKLKTVDLSDNAFGLNTVEPLVKFLQQHTPLKHLLLNNNGLGPEAGALVANALTELAQKKKEGRDKGEEVPELETIICGRNRLESGSAAAWAKTFQAHSGVRSVKMVQNGIRPNGIVVLIRDGLSHCSNLRVLDLQDNTFAEDGSVALAKALPTFRQLEELGVSDALLTSSGVMAVVDALTKRKNKCLKIIRLQFAEMDMTGLQKLVRAIVRVKALPALQRVELNGNKFPADARRVQRLDEILDIRRGYAAGETDDDHSSDDINWGIGELDEMESESNFDDTDSSEYEPDYWSRPAEPDLSSDEKEGLISPMNHQTGATSQKKIDVRKADEEILKEAEQAESEPVTARKDNDVDDLADTLGKTII